MRIAVDAMGGDNAPEVVIEGSLLAAREYPIEILLVGPQATVNELLDKHDLSKIKIQVINASQYVLMGEPAADAVKRKKRFFYARISPSFKSRSS